MRTPFMILLLTATITGLAGCGADGAGSSDAAINPCSPEAPPEEIALEGSPAADGATLHDVVAVEYAFTGVPSTLPPGPHGFRLSTEGEELHELALVRLDDDRPLDVLLDLPEDEQEGVVEYIGGVAACPGTTSPEPLGADLEPGRYALVCYVPVGTTPDLRGDELLEAYENPPHYARGMTTEVTVG